MTVTPQAAIERLFTSSEIEARWFTSDFLAQVPIAQIQLVVAGLKAELGRYRTVEQDGSAYETVFDRGSAPTQIVLNSTGQISGLIFQAARLNVNNLSELTDKFRSLPGRVSLLVLENGAEKVALNPTTPLAVGSAFKLAVLQALRQQIPAQRSWRDVVELRPEWKSLPSGLLQTWPDGSALTLQSLAALMISQSDNTATDSLISLVGREAIEALTPRNRPFLTTREFFALKGQRNEKLLKRFRAGSETQRRTLLTELNDAPLPNVSEFQAPRSLDVEWFFTAQELCDLMRSVQDLPLMTINPGLARAADWQRVVFKGGSEPGVLNLTTWLTAKTGQQFCVVATWNNDRAPVQQSTFFSLYSSLLHHLAS